MVDLVLFIRCSLDRPYLTEGEKKTGVVEHHLVFDYAGLRVDWPPGMAGVPII
jgi:hypothetical protein